MTKLVTPALFVCLKKVGMTGKEPHMELKFQPKNASITMKVVSDAFPKGKQYTLNHLVNDVESKVVETLNNAFGMLVDGKLTATEIHKTDAVYTEE